MSWSMKQVSEAISGVNYQVEMYMKGAQHWDPVMAKIEDKTGYTSASNWGGLNVFVTGDVRKLADVWKELRLLGYKTDYQEITEETPEDKNEREIKFTKTVEGVVVDTVTLHFTSSVCKRVQVGTVMKEVPVYEIKCEEPAPDQVQIDGGEAPISF